MQARAIRVQPKLLRLDGRAGQWLSTTTTASQIERITLERLVRGFYHATDVGHKLTQAPAYFDTNVSLLDFCIQHNRLRTLFVLLSGTKVPPDDTLRTAHRSEIWQLIQRTCHSPAVMTTGHNSEQSLISLALLSSKLYDLGDSIENRIQSASSQWRAALQLFLDVRAYHTGVMVLLDQVIPVDGICAYVRDYLCLDIVGILAIFGIMVHDKAPKKRQGFV